jgi:hypothetical protein
VIFTSDHGEMMGAQWMQETRDPFANPVIDDRKKGDVTTQTE